MDILLGLALVFLITILPWILYSRKSKQYKLAAQKVTDAEKLKNTFLQKVATKHANDNYDYVKKSLTTNNWISSKKKIQKLHDYYEDYGVDLTPSLDVVHSKLRREFEILVRKDFEKQEQKRIKVQIREEQRAERELAKELRRLESEQIAIEKALEKALAKQGSEHSAEVLKLKELLREAEEKNERAKSMAELTKAGHVYVISNIGSFGEKIFKVGMTRRLEPLDRVKELGDASVPFPFDIHMMISCDDAPKLEKTLHQELALRRVNKINLRKEFFQVSIDEINSLVIKHHGKVEYKATPDAFEYEESEQMSDQDFKDLITEKLRVLGREELSVI